MTLRRAKRTWVYIHRPRDYGIAPCSCGNDDPDWSEYKRHLWCRICEKDFIPAHNGVFDGPIPDTISTVLGFSFDRISLKTKKIIPELSEPFIDCDGTKAKVRRKREHRY